MNDLDDYISNVLVLIACVCVLMLSGCFIANAHKRDRQREYNSTNLPPMQVTTNLFNPVRLPAFN